MRVWIDQDLCTGDGLCTDHCPEVFVLLDDGISYVRDDVHIAHELDGAANIVSVPRRLEQQVVVAALDCPGECIFVEDDPTLQAPADVPDLLDVLDATIC